MSIPFATTTVQVLRSPSAAETDAEYRNSDVDFVPVGKPVRAHISAPTGSRSFTPSGSDTNSQFHLVADVADIRSGDQVRDRDGNVYSVDWIVRKQGPLPHMTGGISDSERLS